MNRSVRDATPYQIVTPNGMRRMNQPQSTPPVLIRGGAANWKSVRFQYQITSDNQTNKRGACDPANEYSGLTAGKLATEHNNKSSPHHISTRQHITSQHSTGRPVRSSDGYIRIASRFGIKILSFRCIFAYATKVAGVLTVLD